MNKGVVLAVIVIFLLAGAIAFYIWQGRSQLAGQTLGTVGESVEAVTDLGRIAADLSAQINELSPTRSSGYPGWIAQKVSFVPGRDVAYIEYTDTRIALRMLVVYSYPGGKLLAKVLATFIPDESGGWILQYGKDESPVILSVWKFDGGSNRWVPEANNNF